MSTSERSQNSPENNVQEQRPLTLDDVRGTAGSGRAVAISCTVVVLILVVGFWIIRAFFLG